MGSYALIAGEETSQLPAMKVLLAIPHVFNPKDGSLYSSQTEHKRTTKQKALLKSTIGNIIQHSRQHWIHASLGKGKEVVTRQLEVNNYIELTIQLYTPPSASLKNELTDNSHIQLIDPQLNDYKKVPLFASRRLLEQASNYDLVGYMEDDLFIEDREFFHKILYLDSQTNGSFAFLPHRCEQIPNLGDVILSGDPDGGRPDLFWDTGEVLKIDWPLGLKTFYRATNPHSGCYFLSRRQALRVASYWEERNWKADFELAGPLEQAGSGILIPVLKIMKTIPADYRFLMVRHQDQLWKRHPFETQLREAK